MADKLVPANDVVDVEVSPVGLPEKRRQELSKETFNQLEDEILWATGQVMAAAMSFPEIDPGTEEPPEEWVEQLGPKLALQKFRVAKAAWMCQSEAPVGLKFAQSTYIGALRVRAGDNSQQKPTVSTVVLVQAPQNYPVKELEGE